MPSPSPVPLHPAPPTRTTDGVAVSVDTVLATAWTAAGRRKSTLGSKAGACARCGATGRVVPVRSVLSKAFTGFEGWVDPSGRGLCGACAWGHSVGELRKVAHLVRQDPVALVAASRGEVGRILATPLGVGECLVVPLRPGRKHILPGAVWGRVCVDDAHLPWTDRQARLLGRVAWLRGLGFGSRMLAEPAPAYGVMARLDPQTWTDVLGAWAQLAEWRDSQGPWLALAVYATTPTTATPTAPAGVAA